MTVGPVLRAAGAAVAAGVLLAACGPGPSPTPSGKQATPSPGAPASRGTLAQWQAKGATEVPPGSLLDPPMAGVQVVNQTSGAVSDADAARWGKAMMRGLGYEWWAIDHGQDQFLVRSGLANPARQVFKWDLDNVTGARQAGMTLQGRPMEIRRLVLRPVPQSLQTTFSSNLFVWTPYAFYLDEVGPGDLSWVDPHGTRTSKWHVGAGVGSPELVGGQLATDPLLGDIWVQRSDWNCATDDSRRTFGDLCRS
jgi:hypothetical protein